jgi:Mrp family chromosome partitioning ATPase
MNSTTSKTHSPATGTASAYNHIQHVVAVMSGKGGVGKSLVTSLLAIGLAQNGYHIGILDADITGPSIPMLFGLHGPVEPGDVGIEPLQSKGGVKIMSMNLLLAREDQPVIWRGPMIGKAITQLWGDVMWGHLDYLLVDLPPGTADAALTTMQSLPVNGIVMVTTPQCLASMVVRKAVHMAQAIGVPIIGVVENMSYFVCPDTHNHYFLFGSSHAAEVAQVAGVPLLAQLPIILGISDLCDKGKIEDVHFPEMADIFSKFLQVMPM